MFEGETKPMLRFVHLRISIGELADKVCLIASFGPGFSDISPNGTRRTPDLIDQGTLLFSRPTARILEYSDPEGERPSVHDQLRKMPDWSFVLFFYFSHLISVLYFPTSAFCHLTSAICLLTSGCLASLLFSQSEGFMHGALGVVGALARHRHPDLDLGGGDELDVDLLLGQPLEHPGRH